MNTVITPLTKEEATEFLEASKVVNRIPADLWQKLQSDGWRIVEDYSIEKVHKGIYIVIEFCIGDFCVYPCSKNTHWLLEKKTPNETFIQALVAAAHIEARIEAGEHWVGEDD